MGVFIGFHELSGGFFVWRGRFVSSDESTLFPNILITTYNPSCQSEVNIIIEFPSADGMTDHPRPARVPVPFPSNDGQPTSIPMQVLTKYFTISSTCPAHIDKTLMNFNLHSLYATGE